MSWKITSVMQEKARFILMWQSGSYTFKSLCEEFGISRTAGYNLINAFKEEGEGCLQEKSKRPKNIPHKTPEEVEQKIVELRKKYPLWGARKIKKLAESSYKGEKKIPSETTINAIFTRNELVKPRRKRPPKVEHQNVYFDPAECNEIWSGDYKGKFKLGNGRYCNPLTVCDSKSRKILGIKCHYQATYKSVKQSYTSIFREHGLPLYMHTDNGTPFGSMQAVRRFTRLCYWLIDIGVIPIFSDPGCPQQNGRHERMHRDLKAYCKTRIQTTLSKQQKILDTFREEYNEIRPHEALDMETPTSQHIPSTRVFPEKKIPFTYDLHLRKLKVTNNGAIRWGKHYWVFVSSAAAGRIVGCEEIGNGIWNVYYRKVLLGYLDEKLITHRGQYLKLNQL